MSTIQPYTAADLARLRSVQARPRGWSHQVKPQVTEYRDERTRERIKVILDELGNKVRMRRHGQDVKILNPRVVVGQVVDGRLVNVGVQ